MRIAFRASLLLAGAFVAVPAMAAGEKLLVLPLDTTAVFIDSGLATSALIHEDDAPALTAPKGLIARKFQPRFATAVMHAARRVDVARFPDSSARYVLRIDSLGFSQKTRAVGRRFVPPSAPEFDPATGEMSPGDRTGHAEGPGWMNTLTATAKWKLWDRARDSAVAQGVGAGASEFRGDAQRENWNIAARELAKAVLRETPFSPFK
jgi:hypothetical protein